MSFRIPVLNVQQNEVDVLQFCVTQTNAKGPVGVERGVNPIGLHGGEEFYGKPVLHEGFTTAQGESRQT